MQYLCYFTREYSAIVAAVRRRVQVPIREIVRLPVNTLSLGVHRWKYTDLRATKSLEGNNY